MNCAVDRLPQPEFDTAENDVLAVLESMDSEDATKCLMPSHNAVEGRDIAAWQAIRRLRKGAHARHIEASASAHRGEPLN